VRARGEGNGGKGHRLEEGTVGKGEFVSLVFGACVLAAGMPLWH